MIRKEQEKRESTREETGKKERMMERQQGEGKSLKTGKGDKGKFTTEAMLARKSVQIHAHTHLWLLLLVIHPLLVKLCQKIVPPLLALANLPLHILIRILLFLDQ